MEPCLFDLLHFLVGFGSHTLHTVPSRGVRRFFGREGELRVPVGDAVPMDVLAVFGFGCVGLLFGEESGLAGFDGFWQLRQVAGLVRDGAV